MMLGAQDDAVVVMEKGLQVARHAGIQILQASIARYLGRAYAATGDAEKGHILLDEALKLTRSQGLAGLTAWCSSALGHAHMSGDTARAETALQEALTIATEHSYTPVQAQTLRALGELRLRAGDPAGAEALLRRAIVLTEGMGMRPDLAGARRTLAGALRALGRNAEASVEDEAAATLGLALRPTPAEARTPDDLALLSPERKHLP